MTARGRAIALAGLPRITARQLAGLVGAGLDADVDAAWADVVAGRHGEVWAAAARVADVEALEREHAARGVGVLVRSDPAYPSRLATDHQPPPVLFTRGDPALLDGGPSVAIVGTRRCTHAGREVAAELGRDLAAAGVHVVSGLALGIDGAAHEGALAAGGAPPIGVVACGLDVVYPSRHRALWERVASGGALVSEVPLGVHPVSWRFPMRNRIIAALADLVVVVESNAAGGSMHTVAAAVARDRPVLAVPGPVRSPASAGTNALLADGCAPARDAADVLVALGLHVPDRVVETEPPAPEGVDGEVLEAVDWGPTTLDAVVARSGVDVGRAASALIRLEVDGWVRGDGGRWERQKPPGSRLHSVPEGA